MILLPLSPPLEIGAASLLQFCLLKDKLPVNYHQVQPCSPIPWPPRRVHAHSHPFPGPEKPDQGSWLLCKVTNLLVIFVKKKTVLFRSRGTILSLQKKMKTIYTVYCASSVFSPIFKRKQKHLSSESGMKTKLNFLKRDTKTASSLPRFPLAPYHLFLKQIRKKLRPLQDWSGLSIQVRRDHRI